MSMVMYQVERRPIGDDGHVYRGLDTGDYVLTKTKADVKTTDIVEIARLSNATGTGVLSAHITTTGSTLPSVTPPKMLDSSGALINTPAGILPDPAGGSSGSSSIALINSRVRILRDKEPTPPYDYSTSAGTSQSASTFTQSVKTHFREVVGEPWVVYSTHFSIESAIESAALIASALGAENVRIVKVITGAFQFKLK
jgi:hypothetical protein